jgi:hypothetical protein
MKEYSDYGIINICISVCHKNPERLPETLTGSQSVVVQKPTEI